jgi:amidase
MTVLRPERQQLHALAKFNHFSIEGEERFFEALFERILPHYDELEAIPEKTRTSRYNQRDPGERPPAEQNPCNAFVRRCHIKGSGEGLLAGKRVALKDNICVAGIPLTCGSSVIDHVPSADATIVERLLDQGADIVGIVNMDNLAFSGAGDTSAYGPTVNPYDRSRLAGGSSGGSAAALFSRDVDITIGGDQAGSIRIPASWCGVVGLKPTYGLVPYTGILGYDLSFDHTGPMARRASDVALALQAIAGKDAADPRQRGDVPVQKYLEAIKRPDLKGLRIGVLAEGFGTAGAEPDVDEMVASAADRMRELGATVMRVAFPAHRSAGPIVWGVFAEGVTATFQNNAHGYHWDGLYDPALAQSFGSALQERGQNMPLQCKFNLMLGTFMKQAYQGRFYGKAQNLRASLRNGYDDLLRDVDLLVMPTTPMKAHHYNPSLDPEELVLAGWNMVANTAPFNMTGHPALSVPCGMSSGLPIGMMLVGRHFHDATLLAAAHLVQSEMAIPECAV